jgi:hypothetical protein
MNDAAAARGGRLAIDGRKRPLQADMEDFEPPEAWSEQRDTIERRAVECVLCSTVLKELKER